MENQFVEPVIGDVLPGVGDQTGFPPDSSQGFIQKVATASTTPSCRMVRSLPSRTTERS